MYVKKTLGGGVAPPAYMPPTFGPPAPGGGFVPVRVPTYRPPAPIVSAPPPVQLPPQIIEVPQAGVYRYYDPSRAFVPGSEIRRLADLWRRGEISFEEAFPTGAIVGPTAEAKEAEIEKLAAEAAAGEAAIVSVGKPIKDKPVNMLPWLVLGSLLLFGG